MVSKLRIIWKQTVAQKDTDAGTGTNVRRSQWQKAKQRMHAKYGQPRLFSNYRGNPGSFLVQERKKLQEYRERVREHLRDTVPGNAGAGAGNAADEVF